MDSETIYLLAQLGLFPAAPIAVPSASYACTAAPGVPVGLTLVPLDTVIYENNGMVCASHKITVPLAGVYHCSWQLGNQTGGVTSAEFDAHLCHNGSPVKKAGSGYPVMSYNPFWSVGAAADITCAAGDDIELYSEAPNSGAASLLQGGIQSNYLDVHLVPPTYYP